MKQLFSIIVIAGTLTIIIFNSCNKKDSVPDNIPVPAGSYQQSVNLNMVADTWVNSNHEIYTCTFQGVLGTTNASNNRTVMVYIEQGGQEIQISQRHITYQGNEMWATNSATDVTISYRCSSIMPFHSVSVRIAD